MCKKYQVKLDKYFHHPFNIPGVGKLLYLNMQVYKIIF